MPRKQKITTFLWFDGRAEEAAQHYTRIFKNSKILSVSRLGDGPGGTATIVQFELEGQEFMALNGGPQFQFNEAISLYVDCETQGEVDELWEKLTADGGAPSMCGWLKDKFGLSWQIIPSALSRLMQDPDREKAKRVMEAMLGMQKIDVARLEQAYAGR